MVRRAEHPSQDAPDSKPLPLSPQDRAILELEGSTIADDLCFGFCADPLIAG